MKFLFVLVVLVQDQGSIFMQEYPTKKECRNQMEAHQVEFDIRSIPVDISCQKIKQKKWDARLKRK